ncbi:hypothetical protein GCM10023340_36350 [Nocardioides marinquilinus]|uniref:Helix-turn-helix domain-containing protein n=1 Tax=Nocardioides marinquilinus TaxID=1210400 RepID=A0ABP9Q2N4_9ACTN
MARHDDFNLTVPELRALRDAATAALIAIDARLIDVERRLAAIESSGRPEPRPSNGLIWMNTAQASKFVGKHPTTLLKALEAGELHGHQPVPRGRWAIHVDCLDAWVRHEPCPRHG